MNPKLVDTSKDDSVPEALSVDSDTHSNQRNRLPNVKMVQTAVISDKIGADFSILAQVCKTLTKDMILNKHLRKLRAGTKTNVGIPN